MPAWGSFLRGAFIVGVAVMAVAPVHAGGEPEAKQQKYLSDIVIKHETVDARVAAPRHEKRKPARRGKVVQAQPGDGVVYEVLPWSDGTARISDWCFEADHQFRHLGRWTHCLGD